MADIPEYKQRTKIEPAPVADAGSAFAPLSKSWQVVADFGAKVAQDSANKQAQLAGLEAGKTPGRTLMPPINETTKAFDEAYRAQEYAIASNNATRLLGQLSLEFKKKPTAESLLQFEDQWKKASEQLLQELTPQTRASIAIDIQANFDSAKLKMQDTLLQRSLEAEEDNNKRSLNKTIESISDLNAVGQFTKAAELRDKYKIYFDSDYIKDRYSPAQIAAAKEMLDKVYDQSKWQEEATRFGQTPGLLEEKLKDLAELDPTKDNIKKQEIYLKALQQRDALRSTQNSILTDNLWTKAITTGLDPADIFNAKNQLSAKEFADFELKWARHNAKENEDNALFNQIDNAKNDPNLPGKLATLSADKLNKFLKSRSKMRADALNAQGVPTQDDIFNQIETAKGYPVSFPELNDQVNAIVKSGNPAYAPYVIDKIIQGQNHTDPNYNPHLFSGINEKTQAVVDTYKNAILAGQKPQDAYALANNSVYNVKPEELEARKKVAEEQMRSGGSFDMSTTELSSKQAVKAIGLPTSLDIPASLGLQFRRDLLVNSKVAPTFEQAVKMTADNLRKVWGVTNVNGEPQITYLPVENFVLGGREVIDAVRVNALDQFRVTADTYKTIYDAASSQKLPHVLPYYYEVVTHYPSEKLDKDLISQLEKPLEKTESKFIPYGPFGAGAVGEFGVRKTVKEGQEFFELQASGEPAYKPLKPGEPKLKDIKIRKIWEDGRIEEGNLVIDTDNQSPPTPGENPTYWIGFEKNGVVFPILDPSNPAEAIRFKPETEEILKLNDEFKGKTKLEIYEILQARDKRNQKKTLEAGTVSFPII